MSSAPAETDKRKPYEIRPMQERDLDAAAEVLHGASRPRRFLATTEAARQFLAGSLVHDGKHNLVVICDGKVVGYTCAIRPRGSVAGCGPIAVHPEHSDPWLMSQMLMKSVAAALEHGVGLIRHPMALHKATFAMVYGRMKLDFTGDTYVRLDRKPCTEVPGPALHDAIAVAPEDLSRVVGFDRELFVAVDRSLDYRLLVEYLGGRCWMLERDGAQRGFVFATPGLGIGPLAALDAEAAIDALRIATAFDQDGARIGNVHINLADRELLEEALRLGYGCREPVLLFERSLDGTPSPHRSRGSYCLGLVGVP